MKTKNNKILENRPELTEEQIKEGMDFNKIKNNAALAKSALLKSIIIKGFFGVVAISSALFIYQNYRPSTAEKTQVQVADSTKTINPESSLVVNAKEDNEKTAAVFAEHKSKPDNTIAHKIKDTVAIHYVTDNNNTGVKIGGYAFKNYDLSDDEEKENTPKVSPFITALGPADIKELNRSFAKINDKLYASKYEVSNKLYMIFLNSLKQSGNSGLLSIAQIDTLKWRDKLTYNEPYVHYYHTHPAYQNYPLVNINHEAANLFCEWLTAQYNSDPKRKFKKVLFRLPSEEEWIAAAQGGDASAIYPWEGTELRNKKGQIMSNFIRGEEDTMGVAGTYSDNADVTAPVTAYWKNNFGLYNMSGNVAEMINEKGIAKGGSWRDGPEYLKITAKYKYDGKAQSFVGFRYFAEIIEK